MDRMMLVGLHIVRVVYDWYLRVADGTSDACSVDRVRGAGRLGHRHLHGYEGDQRSCYKMATLHGSMLGAMAAVLKSA